MTPAPLLKAFRSGRLSRPLLLAAALASTSVSAARADELSPAVGKPLEKAKAALARHSYAQATAAVNEAASHSKTPYENFIVAEMRGAVAQQSGDTRTAATAYEQIIDSGRVSGAQLQQLLMAEASMAYQQKDYGKTVGWLQRYEKAGGRSPEVTKLMIQSYYQNHDYANAARMQQAQIAATVKAGQRPTEEQLQLLSACQRGMNDHAGFNRTLELLVTYYPKQDYWGNLIHGMQSDPNFPSRLAFDLERLRLAVGLLTSEDDYMDMIETAVQDKAPGEAKAIVDKGYAAGILGKGPQAAREARLKDLVDKRIATAKAQLPQQEAAAQNGTGADLVEVGTTYASLGEYDKGLALMKAGIAKGGLRYPDQAKLDLGFEEAQAGQKAAAIATFKTVGGPEAQLARLWILHLNAKA